MEPDRDDPAPGDRPLAPDDASPVLADPVVAEVVDAVAAVAGVVGVALGGSRARGLAHEDSDWDLGVFVAPPFQPAAVRAVVAERGWSGTVVERGEWGPVVDGGAWLEVAGRKVDLLWRDVAGLARLAQEAERGEFTVVRIPFHLAGLPSYTPLGELSVNRRLRGRVPVGMAMPAALRRRGAAWWLDNARFDLDYANALAGRGGPGAGRDRVVVSGLLARATLELAHARQCHDGRWVLNEKGLLVAAGLDEVAGAGGTVDLSGWAVRAGAALDALAQQLAQA